MLSSSGDLIRLSRHQSLDLRQNDVGLTGATQLLLSSKNHKSLVRLQLEENPCPYEILIAIKKCMTNNASIKHEATLQTHVVSLVMPLFFVWCFQCFIQSELELLNSYQLTTEEKKQLQGVIEKCEMLVLGFTSFVLG